MAKKTREAFYKLILYTVFSLLNSKVDTEVKSVLGRADVGEHRNITHWRITDAEGNIVEDKDFLE